MTISFNDQVMMMMSPLMTKSASYIYQVSTYAREWIFIFGDAHNAKIGHMRENDFAYMAVDKSAHNTKIRRISENSFPYMRPLNVRVIP